MVLALIQHEVPEHELVQLLELRKENLEIVEVEIAAGAAAAGKRIEELQLPETARLISVMRGGKAEIAVGGTELRSGDQVLAILEPGREVLVAKDGAEVAELMRSLDAERARGMGQEARRRVLAEHTYAHRAVQVEKVLGYRAPKRALSALEGVA